jgi:hypothetical protein
LGTQRPQESKGYAMSSSCKAKTSNKFLLDKKPDKFTGRKYFLLDKLVFFTGQKILDTYQLFTGQKDKNYRTLNPHSLIFHPRVNFTNTF